MGEICQNLVQKTDMTFACESMPNFGFSTNILSFSGYTMLGKNNLRSILFIPYIQSDSADNDHISPEDSNLE